MMEVISFQTILYKRNITGIVSDLCEILAGVINDLIRPEELDQVHIRAAAYPGHICPEAAAGKLDGKCAHRSGCATGCPLRQGMNHVPAGERPQR